MKHDILIVVVAILVTMLTRFLPFVIIRGDTPTPKLILYLGRVLPFAIIGMLVVYCLKDISFLAPPYGVPELLGCLCAAALHCWKRNTLLSIGGSTLFYMVLLQFTS